MSFSLCLSLYPYLTTPLSSLTFYPRVGHLEVQHLEEVVGQCVDLIGYRGQALGGVAFRLLQSCPLVVALRFKFKIKKLYCPPAVII